MSQHTRPRAGRRARAFVPGLDRLEARIALACVVTFDPAAQALTVLGDDAANHISVAATKPNGAATGQITVVCDGQTSQFTTPDLKSISVSGGAGDDVIGVYFRGFRPSTINVSGDAGNDTIAVAGGGTIFDYLNGTPTTQLALTVSGDGSADAASSGNDNIGVALNGLALQNSSITVRGDAGNDHIGLSLSAVVLGAGTQVSVLGGAGNDGAAVGLSDVIASGASLVLDGGAGANTLAFAVGGLSVGSAGFNATVDADASGVGAGNALIGVALANLSLDPSSSMTVNINGRGGNDTIAYSQVGLNLAAGSTVTTNLQAGDGNDTVSAVAILTLGQGQSILNLDGGPGTDSLFLFAPRPKRGGPLTVTVTGFETQRAS
jgi:hypothetical protein